MPAPDGPSADHARAAIAAALGQIGFCLPGPYIQWTGTVKGKTVTRLLTPAQYETYAAWLASTRRLRALAAELETLSLKKWPGPKAGPRSPLAARRRRGPAQPGAQTFPEHPKRREMSPLNPGTALQKHPITAGQQGFVVGPRFFEHLEP